MIDHKLKVLELIGKKLNALGILWNVGASCMLYLRHMTDHFDDIDIMITEKDAIKVKESLSEIGHLMPAHSSKQYQTTHFYEFEIQGVDVDIIAGYKILLDGKVYYFPLEEQDTKDYIYLNQEKIPRASVDNWLTYYRLMKRIDKVNMIESYVKEG